MGDPQIDERHGGPCVIRRNLLRGVALIGLGACAALAPTEALAADQTLTFPNGGHATLHDDGSITGVCELVDCHTHYNDAGYLIYDGSAVVMPDGTHLEMKCYEKYLYEHEGNPAYADHAHYMGPWNGASTFTATVDGDSYFVLVHSQDMRDLYEQMGIPNPWGETSYPTQRIYGEGWDPVYTGHAGAAPNSVADGSCAPWKTPEHTDWV